MTPDQDPVLSPHRILALHMLSVVDRLEREGYKVDSRIAWDIYNEKYKGKDFPRLSFNKILDQFQTELIDSGAVV